MKGGSVLAHVTDWNDAADEESAPFCRAKRGFAPDPTKGAALWNPAKGAQAPLESCKFWAFREADESKKVIHQYLN